ncbi:MAG: hypothetical protein HYS05_03545 [Acidobacteria bacterium]|nr:hypothetical protein [Acidobacteriota bacterium]
MKALLHVTDRVAFGLAVLAVAIGVSLIEEAVRLAEARSGQVQRPAPGPLEVPARTVPVPTTVSPEMQALIGAPLSSNWNLLPKSAEEWKAMSAPSAGRGLPALRERFGVTSEPLMVNGVKAYMVTPQVIPPENRNHYMRDGTAPETKEAFEEIARFFDRHLGR